MAAENQYKRQHNHLNATFAPVDVVAMNFS
jgi:hypothetical protein